VNVEVDADHARVVGGARRSVGVVGHGAQVLLHCTHWTRRALRARSLRRELSAKARCRSDAGMATPM
jgi:hypothetical protein